MSAGVSIGPTHFEAGLGAAIWSPSVSFDAFGGSVDIGVHLGLKLGISYGEKFGLDLGIVSVSYAPN